jgi:hypothetical protein
MIGCTRGSATPRIWRDRLILSNVRQRSEPAHAPHQQQADGEGDAKKVNHRGIPQADEEIWHDFP